jgi:hypothetical protein
MQYISALFCERLEEQFCRMTFFFSAAEFVFDFVTFWCSLKHKRPWDGCVWKIVSRIADFNL